MHAGTEIRERRSYARADRRRKRGQQHGSGRMQQDPDAARGRDPDAAASVAEPKRGPDAVADPERTGRGDATKRPERGVWHGCGPS
jgi:hypothetical protein